MSAQAMIVAGIMSGTSADGVDVAVARITPGRPRPKLTLLAHEGFPYPAALRRAVLSAMNAASTSTAELARLNWRLGLAYAEAVSATLKRHRVKVDLIGCHGQTLYHQARAQTYAGRKFACTWQAGESKAIAAALGVPVISNFRPADMFAGGQGAPLVPLLDYVLFADAKRGRVLQNIGGIANLTAIPAAGTPSAVVAFDTGPGNMVMDALAQQFFNKTYDRNGSIAARGTVLKPALEKHAGLVLLPSQAAAHRRTRAIWARVCREVCRELQTAQCKAGRCAGHCDCADSEKYREELQAIRSAHDEKSGRGLHCGRWRGA